MDQKLSFSARGIVMSGLVLLALVAAYIVGGSGAGYGDDGGREDSRPRTLTMVGVGTATAVPDRVGFSVQVGATRDDLDTALADTTTQLQIVLDTLADQGVDEADIATTGLSMSPSYAYVNRKRVFRGYRVSQRIEVEADLDGAGEIVPAIVEAAGNSARVSDLRLQVGEPEAVLAEARAAAIEQARAKAEEYAEATGLELGDVVTVSEVIAEPAYDDYGYAAGGSVAYDSARVAASIPIQAGESDLAAQVQVVWEVR